MRKLIRNQGTGLFFTTDGGWTKDRSKAWVMESVVEACKVLQEFKLQDVELYFSFFDEYSSNNFDFSTPIDLSTCKKGKRSGH